jgi:hypothetical protein
MSHATRLLEVPLDHPDRSVTGGAGVASLGDERQRSLPRSSRTLRQHKQHGSRDMMRHPRLIKFGQEMIQRLRSTARGCGK